MERRVILSQMIRKAMAVFVTGLLFLALGAGTAEAKKNDKNSNGIPDRWEKRYGLSIKKDQSRKDNDRDGLNNRSEWRSATNPKKVDSDGDGLEDADEDRDRDRVDNGNEQRQKTRANDPDSDDDGKRDGIEDADGDDLANAGEDSSGNDPLDADSDDDGVSDGDEYSGVVNSFDGTNLVIDLDTGGQVSGTVGSTTRVTCEDEDGHEDNHRGLSLRSGDSDSNELKGRVVSVASDHLVVQPLFGPQIDVYADGDTELEAPDRDSSGDISLEDFLAEDRVEAEMRPGTQFADSIEVDEPEIGEDGEEIKGVISAISISPDTVTITGRMGEEYIVDIDSSTFLRAPDRDSSGDTTLADFQVGDRVEADMPQSGNVALSLRVRDMEDPDDEDGYEDGEDGDEEAHDGGACPADLLVPGARVHEAELADDGSFVEVEIVSPDDDSQELEEVEGQVISVDGNSVTLLDARTQGEVTASLLADSRILCKSLYGGKPVVCPKDEVVAGVLLHEIEIEDGAIDKMVLLK